jgi:galactokinase
MGPAASAVDLFQDHFGTDPEIVVRAPGRVNLIGEHTDYNDGFVLPMAIDLHTAIAARRRHDGAMALISEGFGEGHFTLAALQHGNSEWFEYVKGVAWSLGADHLTGWDGALASSIPLGASLSSSAALEVGSARVFAAFSGLDWDPVEAALAAQRAENEWVGMRSGIMDQLISATGVAGHAVLIDCRTLDRKPCPLPAETAIVVLDTATRRRLTDSSYNRRRAECEAAATAFGAGSLREVTVEDLARPPAGLDATLLKRARHVVTENQRTVAAAAAMAEGDAARLGSLMDASHDSLRDDYEVSSPALDAFVTAARHSPGCLGARMTGGGFGGCAVALVRAGQVAEFTTAAAGRYESETGHHPAVYVCVAADGVSLTPLP